VGATRKVFFTASKNEGHFNEKFLAILPNLGLIPENFAEKGQSRAQDKVELHFSFVEDFTLCYLWNIEAPAKHEISLLFDSC
jgi:hypothetical protein